MVRDEHGGLSILTDDHRMLLLIPGKGRGISDTLLTQLNKVSTNSLEIVETTDKDVLSGGISDRVDLRNKAGGKARYAMHRMEIKLVEDTDHVRDENS